MLFDLLRRGKKVKKINLLHFSVFTSKNFVILKLPEPSTDSGNRTFSVSSRDNTKLLTITSLTYFGMEFTILTEQNYDT